MIELLIVIAIIGILTTIIISGVMVSRRKALDNNIKSDVRQLRLLAEEVYDNQAASYANWSDKTAQPSMAIQLERILNDIDTVHGYIPQDISEPGHIAVTRDSQSQEYCISAPLVTNSNTHFCVDATGRYVEVSSACPDSAADGEPLRCPTP